MPRDSRWLTASVMAVVTSLTLVGCTGDDPETRNRSPLPRVPPTEQPVDPPGGAAVVPGNPLDGRAFEGPVERPNLLMITVDDAAWGDMEYLPQLQRLVARQGVTLDNGLAPTPICVPARASLITGQYAHNHGALTINGEGGGHQAFEDQDTLPVWLQEAGYDTLFLGKYLNGYGAGDPVPPGWTDWRGTEDPTTYNFTHPTINENGTSREYEQYSTDLFADLTEDMLTDPARIERPWYLWANYVAPHTGGPENDDDPPGRKTTSPAPEDEDAFADLDLPDKPNMFEEDISDKELAPATRTRWSPEHRAELREAYQQRIESLQSVDRAIGRSIETLRDTGQLDRTYVVVTSDNGYVTGEHNLNGKLWYFHDIVGAPMLIRGPGLPRGVHSRTPVTNADWAPTFAALAGATPGRTVDGVDVMPWLDRPTTTRVVPIEAYPVHGGTSPLYTGVVVGPWTYVRNRAGRAEVYYREVDPWETHNVRRDPRYRQQVRELARLTDRYADCAGAACPREFYE